MKQGTKANYTGANLEKFIRDILERKGYVFVDKRRFEPACILDQAIFTEQYLLGDSIYDTPLKCDFVLRHPIKHPDCLVVESKWQEKSGSVDEKYPYLVHNIKEKFPHPTIIVIDGGGYKPGAEQWLRDQVGGNLLHVFNMTEFMRWSNSEEL